MAGVVTVHCLHRRRGALQETMIVNPQSSRLARIRHAGGRLGRLGWAPFLILGPITGSLIALCLFNIRKRRPIYAACCIAGIVVFWIAAPALLKSELNYIRSHKSGLADRSRPLVAAVLGRAG